jgi:hypothetical protein
MVPINEVLSVFSCLGIALTLAYVIGFWRRLLWRSKTQRMTGLAVSDPGELAQKVQSWAAALESMFERPQVMAADTQAVPIRHADASEAACRSSTPNRAQVGKPLAMISHGTFLLGLLAAIGLYVLVLRGQSATSLAAGSKPKIVKVITPPPPTQPKPENDAPPVTIQLLPEFITPTPQPSAPLRIPTPIPRVQTPLAPKQDGMRLDRVAEIRKPAGDPTKGDGGNKDASENLDALPPMEICWSGLVELRSVTQNLGMRILAVNETAGNQILGEVSLGLDKPVLQPWKGSLEAFSNRVRMLPTSYFPELAVANPGTSFWVVVPTAVDREFCETQRQAVRARGLEIPAVRSMTGRFKLGPLGRFILEIIGLDA